MSPGQLSLVWEGHMLSRSRFRTQEGPGGINGDRIVLSIAQKSRQLCTTMTSLHGCMPACAITLLLMLELRIGELLPNLSILLKFNAVCHRAFPFRPCAWVLFGIDFLPWGPLPFHHSLPYLQPCVPSSPSTQLPVEPSDTSTSRRPSF